MPAIGEGLWVSNTFQSNKVIHTVPSGILPEDLKPPYAGGDIQKPVSPSAKWTNNAGSPRLAS